MVSSGTAHPWNAQAAPDVNQIACLADIVLAIHCRANGALNNPGAVDQTGCGAESDPNMNSPLPDAAARRRVSASAGAPSTGTIFTARRMLGCQSTRHRWCGVMVACR